jgi:integrase
VHEASLLLEAARRSSPVRPDLTLPFLHELLATFLLTGGRKREILGLEIADVSFERKTIRIRANGWRRLKTRTSDRSVPMWPQLEAILKPYVEARRKAVGDCAGRLLFPTQNRSGDESLLTDFRKALDRVTVSAGWNKGDVTTKMFRHTYCAARLQTLDGGYPVSVYTVGKELGHGGDSMVKAVYGHLGTVRHRAEVVEYRVEQHEKALADRLLRLVS